MSFFGTRRQSEASKTIEAARAPAAGQQPIGFETVLGASSVMEGTFKSGANVRLDGTFRGTLEITGNVLVGETAQIYADIHARNVSIAGAVHGNVSGRKVQILRTGRIWGDIHAQSLATEEGAFIDGKITMVAAETTPVTEEVATAQEAQPSEVAVSEAESSQEAALEQVKPIEDAAPEAAREEADQPADEMPVSDASADDVEPNGA